MRPKSICAVIVIFNPQVKELLRNLNAISRQVDSLVIVDNSDKETIGKLKQVFEKEKNIFYLKNNENVGLAAAQNLGIHMAFKEGFEFTILFDQDSMPEQHMVAELVSAYIRKEKQDKKIIGVGPYFLDPRSNLVPCSIRFGLLGIKRTPIGESKNDRMVKTEFLVSSGLMFRTAHIVEMGVMDERLFIEHIDTEWCLRARKRGRSLYLVRSARMIHQLGSRVTRYWFFGWRYLAMNLPFRNYYIFRNSVLLYKRPGVYWLWKYNDLLRLLKLFLANILVGDRRLDRIGFSLRGVWDGFRGVSGKVLL